MLLHTGGIPPGAASNSATRAPGACVTHGAWTQQCTAWKVHGVGVHHVRGLPGACSTSDVAW